MSECKCYVKAGITEGVRASWRQLVCKELPLYARHEGAPYCVLHYPGKDKESDFQEAIDQKLAGEDNAFQAVYFPLLFPNTLVGWLSPERLNKRARFAGATFEAGASFFRTTLDYAGFTGALL
jgi:hypothetical protein